MPRGAGNQYQHQKGSLRRGSRFTTILSILQTRPDEPWHIREILQALHDAGDPVTERVLAANLHQHLGTHIEKGRERGTYVLLSSSMRIH